MHYNIAFVSSFHLRTVRAVWASNSSLLMIVRFSLDSVDFIPKTRGGEKKISERKREWKRKSACTRADTGPSVNGWMNLGEKGCLWAAESVAARLINEALARGPEEDQQQLRYQGGELIDRYPCLLIYQSTSRSTAFLSNGECRYHSRQSLTNRSCYYIISISLRSMLFYHSCSFSPLATKNLIKKET